MRHLFQVHLVALQCRDILNTIKADGDNKYKLSDILQVINFYAARSFLTSFIIRKLAKTMLTVLCWLPTPRITAISKSSPQLLL
jgi:hypothetical protein